MQSFGAVLAGVLVGVVLSLATDALLRGAGVFPVLGEEMASPLLVLATFYRTVYGVASSYMTARLAPYQPMKHALILGVLGGTGACR